MSRRSPADDWRAEFRTEARLREVSGAEIGEALAEVDTFCADSGEDPYDTFGDPAEYAEVLAARSPATGHPSGGPRPHRTGVLMACGTLAGVMSVLTGVDAIRRDSPGTVTTGQLVSFVAGVAGIVLITWFLLRPGRRHRRGFDWRLGLAAAVGIGITAYPQVVWKQPLLHAPGWVLLGAGLLVLALGWWPLLSGRVLADLEIDPRTGSESAPGPKWLLGVVRWGLPVALCCVVVIAVLIRSVGPG
ncbi:hypothetical protein ACN27G_03275 [Plantactinospora sp. WMMB334]|uniref:hypothetical protein n=1 Tax=Plantactinospora sp. WMMB334 TaxID=3404119 RepID=UPI003B94051C